MLIVRWESVAAHQGFRDSDSFAIWKGRLGDHRDGAFVEHFETLLDHAWQPHS